MNCPPPGAPCSGRTDGFFLLPRREFRHRASAFEERTNEQGDSAAAGSGFRPDTCHTLSPSLRATVGCCPSAPEEDKIVSHGLPAPPCATCPSPAVSACRPMCQGQMRSRRKAPCVCGSGDCPVQPPPLPQAHRLRPVPPWCDAGEDRGRRAPTNPGPERPARPRHRAARSRASVHSGQEGSLARDIAGSPHGLRLRPDAMFPSVSARAWPVPPRAGLRLSFLREQKSPEGRERETECGEAERREHLEISA